MAEQLDFSLPGGKRRRSVSGVLTVMRTKGRNDLWARLHR